MKDRMQIKCIDGDGVIIYNGTVKVGKELIQLSKMISKKYK